MQDSFAASLGSSCHLETRTTTSYSNSLSLKLAEALFRCQRLKHTAKSSVFIEVVVTACFECPRSIMVAPPLLVIVDQVFVGIIMDSVIVTMRLPWPTCSTNIVIAVDFGFSRAVEEATLLALATCLAAASFAITSRNYSVNIVAIAKAAAGAKAAAISFIGRSLADAGFIVP